MTSLTRRLEHEIVGNHKRGTIDYFCGELKIDNPTEVAFSMAELESKGKVELIGTTTSYAGNGLPVIQGVYAVSSEALADRVVKSIEKFDKEYVKSHGNSWPKAGLDRKMAREANETIRAMIISKLREARQIN